jgi:hypothetical protein
MAARFSLTSGSAPSPSLDQRRWGRKTARALSACNNQEFHGGRDLTKWGLCDPQTAHGIPEFVMFRTRLRMWHNGRRISAEAQVAVPGTATMPPFASVKPWRAAISVRARVARGKLISLKGQAACARYRSPRDRRPRRRALAQSDSKATRPVCHFGGVLEDFAREQGEGAGASLYRRVVLNS